MVVADVWAELVRAHGSAHLGRPDLDVPPAHTTGTLERFGELLHVALFWAGLEDCSFTIIDDRGAHDETYLAATHPVLTLSAVEGRRLILHVEQLSSDDVLLAAIGHEVARAFVALSKGGSTYREAGDDPVHRLTEDDEWIAGVASVYLGFGTVIASAGRQYRRVAHQSGALVSSQQAQFIVGSLIGQELIEALALRLAARGLVEAEVERALGSLTDSPAEALREALAGLVPGALPPTLSTQVPPLPAHLRERLVAQERAFRKPLEGSGAVRYFERHGALVGGIGAMMSVPFAVFVPGPPFLPFVVIAGVGGLGTLLGRYVRSVYCGGCMARVRKRDETCWGCGATLGELLPMSARQARLEREEEEDDELTRQALADERE